MKNLRCFQHVNWNPGHSELRRFSIAMLVGFGVLGFIAAVKTGHAGNTSIVLWTVGVVLALAAIAGPLGRSAYLTVYLPTSVIGWVVSHVLLTVLFYGPFTLIGVLMRLSGVDPLMRRIAPGAAVWRPIDTPESDESYYRQF